MSSFTADLVVEVEQGERAGRGLARLVLPFVYEVGALGSGDRIVVPAGFETDFCSIPWFARWLFAPLDRAAKAGVLHDWLLECKDRPRREADAIFREALGVLGVKPWRRWIMWAAVRVRAISIGQG